MLTFSIALSNGAGVPGTYGVVGVVLALFAVGYVRMSRRITNVGVAGADPAQDHHGFRTEFFGPAMVTTSLPGDARQYLQRAVEFCNDRLYGTLSVNIIVHPATRARLGTDFDRAIAPLRTAGSGSTRG